jgi:hypothetical protein
MSRGKQLSEKAWQEVKRLQAKGVSTAGIAIAADISESSVRRLKKMSAFSRKKQGRRPLHGPAQQASLRRHVRRLLASRKGEVTLKHIHESWRSRLKKSLRTTRRTLNKIATWKKPLTGPLLNDAQKLARKEFAELNMARSHTEVACLDAIKVTRCSSRCQINDFASRLLRGEYHLHAEPRQVRKQKNSLKRFPCALKLVVLIAPGRGAAAPRIYCEEYQDTLNGERLVPILTRLNAKMRRGLSPEQRLRPIEVHQDNDRVQNSLLVKSHWDHLDWFPRPGGVPTYSPDLSCCDAVAFPVWKLRLAREMQAHPPRSKQAFDALALQNLQSLEVRRACARYAENYGNRCEEVASEGGAIRR